ncbi:MAG: response regulator [Campylobacterota bacterium]|nr:response regulator [Campylobacterota bacterium]
MSKLQQLQESMGALKVLYVEDEEGVREQTLIFLKKIFKNIDSASNGEEGLERFKEKAYDLVISDLKMPKMNGREMLRQIHELDKDAVLIVMTASDSNMDASETVSDAYLKKPVMFMDFVEVLESMKERLQKR